MAWLLSWLVQGLAVALIARAAMRMLPRLSAATRYAIWWAAVLLVVLLPAIRAGLRDHPAAVPDNAPTDAPSVARDGAPAIVPPVTLPRLPDWMLAVAIGAWLGTAMLGLAQLAYSVSTVRRLKQSCRRLTTPRESQLPLWSGVRHRRRGVRVGASDRLRTAAVLGLRRPIIAVPRDVSASLTAEELDQVILHEYAHVRRFDDWGKLLQVAIGAFFGWHPAVRVMMREIDLEREAACDDWVVSVTGAPRAYARCLTKMAGFVPAIAPAPAIPYAASTSHITRRIERLLAAPAVDARRGSARLAPLPALTAIAALVVVTFATVRAFPVAMDLESIARDAAVVDASAGHSAGAPLVDTRATREGATSGELRITTAAMLPMSLSFSGLASLTARPRISESAATTPSPSVTPTPASTAAPMAGAEPTPAPATDAPLAPPTRAVDTHAARTTPSEAHVERVTHHDTFSLGPVVPAADSTSMAMIADDKDNVDKTWGAVARDATTRAVGIGARSVGSATRTATSTAASNVKSATTTAARAIGRATRKVFPF